jgi:hypothetical protein
MAKPEGQEGRVFERDIGGVDAVSRAAEVPRTVRVEMQRKPR